MRIVKMDDGREFFATESGKFYATCNACKQLVRVNKPIFGDLHICVSEENMNRKRHRAGKE